MGKGGLLWGLGEGARGTYEAGEWEFEEEEVCGALVAADFTEGESAGSVAAGFSGGRFAVFSCNRQ